MVSWKLIKANSDSCRSILIAIVLCVTVLIASLLYIDYSMQDLAKETHEKYGGIDVVFYDSKGDPAAYHNLISQEEVIKAAWQSNMQASAGPHGVILHVIDLNAHYAINDMKNIKGDTIGNEQGIYLNSHSLELLGAQGNTLNLTVNGITKLVGIAHILDKESYYEVANQNQINIYMDIDYYLDHFEGEVIKNVYLVDLGEVTSKTAYQFAQNFDGLVFDNIVDKTNVQERESSQSFIYAVSFILIGLLGIVLGGLYNFCKTIILENIENIGFFRTLGLSHHKSSVLYQYMVLQLGIIGWVLGLILGIILGNLFICIMYGMTVVVPPNITMLLLSLMVSVIFPFIFMAIEIGKYKKMRPIHLLLLYRNKGYDEKEDSISKYAINGLIYFSLYALLTVISGETNDGVKVILSALAIFAAVKAIENLIVVCLHMLSMLSKKFIHSRPILSLSFKNLKRNKKKTASVIGTLVLIVAFHIGMYNVFYTIRTDAVDKVELQYNGAAFITEYNQSQDVIMEKINEISRMPIVKAVGTSHSRYLTIEGSRIEGYILSENEFKEFFSVLDIQTGEKAVLPNFKQGGVIGEALAKKGGIKVGDTLTIMDNSKTYEITAEAICDAYEYMGNVVFLNEKHYSYPVNAITMIFSEGVDVDDGIEEIRETFSEDDVFIPEIRSKEQIKENYRRNAIKGTLFIEIVLVFITTMGVFILINQVVQFINGRTREFALLRIMGTSFAEIRKMNIAEFMTMVFVGIFGSILAGLMVTRGFVDIASITSGIGEVLSYHYYASHMISISLYILILYSLSLVYILNKHKNKSLIMGIKEE